MMLCYGGWQVWSELRSVFILRYNIEIIFNKKWSNIKYMELFLGHSNVIHASGSFVIMKTRKIKLHVYIL